MPIATPLPRAGHLDPARAGRLAKRGRALLRAGEITYREWAVLDCLLWSCRQPGHDLAVASYSALQRLAHMARGTVAAALDKLQALGLIERIRRRVRVTWHQGGTASRQITSIYRLVPPDPARHTEFSPRTVIQGMEITIPPSGDVAAAQEALRAVRERRRPVLDALLRGRTAVP